MLRVLVTLNALVVADAFGMAPASATLRAVGRSSGAAMAEKSQALPFQDRPASLGAVGAYAGDRGFDPLGLSNIGIPLTYMKEAELKHGRVCMLATVGYISTDTGLRAPGVPKELLEVNSFKAHDVAVADGRMLALLLACGVFEIAGFAGLQETMAGGSRKPGDFMLTGGFDKDPKTLERMYEAEISHCRLAMMAFSGIVTQSAIGGGADFPYF